MASGRSPPPPPPSMVDTDHFEFDISLLPQELSSSSPPKTPTFNASPSHFSPPTTHGSRQTVEYQKEWKASRTTRPKWYMLSFGSMKMPPEMEMKDMKTRQMRRKESIDRVCTPMEVASGGGRKAPCWLLRSLACSAGLDDYTLSPARLVI